MKFLTTLLTVLTFATALTAERFYVKPAGTADGTSWEQATNLDDALNRAVAGDEIWATDGLYVVNNTAGRQSTFLVPAGVKLYGGFAGTELTLAHRMTGFHSVLSGDIGQPEVTADNVYTVVTLASDNEQPSVFDGFLVTGGTSRNFKEGLTIGSAGGGLFIEAGETLASHMIANCIFTDNKAHNGGAVLVDSGSPSFINCVFKGNTADFNGGAVYNQGTASVANPIFRNCLFEDNSSNSGAGMTNNGTNGSANPLIVSCQFVNNTSLMNGAAIYNISDDSGETQPVIENSVFIGNDSVLGEDVSDDGVTRAIAIKARQSRGGSLSPVRKK